MPAYDPDGSPWDLLKPNPEPAKPPAPAHTSVSQTSEVAAPLPSVVTPSAPSVEPPTVVAVPLNREDEDLVKFLSASLSTSKRPPSPSQAHSEAPAPSPAPPELADGSTSAEAFLDRSGTPKPPSAPPPAPDEAPESVDEDLLTDEPGPATAAVAAAEALPEQATSPSVSPPPLASTVPPVAADGSLERRYGPASPQPSAPLHSATRTPLVASEPPPGRAAHWVRWLAVAALAVAGLTAAFAATQSWRTPPAPAPEPVRATPSEPSPPAVEQVAVPAATPAERPAVSAEPAASLSEAAAAGAPSALADINLVTLTVSPPDAMISRPGNEPRRSPAVYHLEKGERLVVNVSCWGYLSRTVVLDGSSPDVAVTLARAPGAAAKSGKSDQARAAGTKQNPVPTRRFEPVP